MRRSPKEIKHWVVIQRKPKEGEEPVLSAEMAIHTKATQPDDEERELKRFLVEELAPVCLKDHPEDQEFQLLIKRINNAQNKQPKSKA